MKAGCEKNRRKSSILAMYPRYNRNVGSSFPSSYRVSLQDKKKEVDSKMANVDLSKYGITGVTEIVHNPSYELLFEEETKAGLVGFEVG